MRAVPFKIVGGRDVDFQMKGGRGLKKSNIGRRVRRNQVWGVGSFRGVFLYSSMNETRGEGIRKNVIEGEGPRKINCRWEGMPDQKKFPRASMIYCIIHC